jgi:hypothetical protein
VFLHHIKDSAHFTVFATTFAIEMDGIELLAEIYDVYCECNSQMRKIAGHELLLKMYIIF